jgi:hypothetical protein
MLFRLAPEHMHFPGLKIGPGWGTSSDLQDTLDGFARDRLWQEGTGRVTLCDELFDCLNKRISRHAFRPGEMRARACTGTPFRMEYRLIYSDRQ